MLMRIRLSAILLLLNFYETEAQKKTNFEDVTLEELQMSRYEPDSSAAAVILLDLGRLEGNSMRFTRKLRVKILSQAGFSWGNWVINTPTRSDFKVVTHNLVDGKIVSERADNKSIHEQRVIDEFEVYKVFAPNVKAGSVIDITYSFVGIPFEWRFQERIPVVFSELTMDPTRTLFDKTHFGFEPIETISPNQWRARNVPAFKEEPFLNNYSNYISKFEFQWAYLFTKDWRTLVNRLSEDGMFGRLQSNTPYLSDFAKEVKAKDLSVKERIQAAFDYLRKNMKWNGEYSLFPSFDLRERFTKTHTGNSADINLLLIALLRKLEVEVYPVVLSTRNHGLLVEFSPSVFKLNNVVGYVQEKDVDMFIDATSEFVEVPGILPAQCINSRGLLVKKDNEQWFSLDRNYVEGKKQYVTIVLDIEAGSRAKVFYDYSGYGYLNWREELKESNMDTEILKNNIQKKHPELNVLKYEVTRVEPKTLMGKETIELDVSNQLIEAGDIYLLNPFVMVEYKENPFKAEDRKYPVDMNYPRDFTTTVVVQLPKGFTAQTVPESIKLNSSDGSASFTYMASATGQQMTFRATMKINRHIFTESEYKELRIFFSEVVKKLNTPIELAKT